MNSSIASTSRARTSPTVCTLSELFAALSETGATENEVDAALLHLLQSGRARLSPETWNDLLALG